MEQLESYRNLKEKKVTLSILDWNKNKRKNKKKNRSKRPEGRSRKLGGKLGRNEE